VSDTTHKLCCPVEGDNTHLLIIVSSTIFIVGLKEIVKEKEDRPQGGIFRKLLKSWIWLNQLLRFSKIKIELQALLSLTSLFNFLLRVSGKL